MDSILHVAITDLHHDYSWDIHKVRGLYTHLISYLIAEPPIRIRADGEYAPSLFKAWSFNSEKTELTVEVSRDFKFHDGTPITADAVLYSLNKALDKKAKQGGHNDLVNSLCSGKRCDITRVGKDKLKFNFKRFTNAILPSFTLSELSIFPKSYYKVEDKKSVLDNLAGPYKVESFEPNLMKLKAQRGHPLVSKKSPEYVYLHQVRGKENLGKFFERHENAVVFSAHANRAAELDLPDADIKVFPPMVAEVVQLNRYNSRLKDTSTRKRIASKLFRIFESVKQQKTYTKRAKQYFPPYSIAHINEDVENYYLSKFDDKIDKLKIVTYDELGFDSFFTKFKEVARSFSLDLELEVQGKKEFFNKKGKVNQKSEEPEAFYYFSGVGTPNPIFELTYMIERTNGQRYAQPSILKLLEKARYEINEERYSEYLSEIHKNFLTNYLIVPVRHSSPVFHIKGNYIPQKHLYTGELDFWNWQKKER